MIRIKKHENNFAIFLKSIKKHILLPKRCVLHTNIQDDFANIAITYRNATHKNRYI